MRRARSALPRSRKEFLREGPRNELEVRPEMRRGAVRKGKMRRACWAAAGAAAVAGCSTWRRRAEC
eukprot:3982828-Prorocentrum_lima.AAC.1